MFGPKTREEARESGIEPALPLNNDLKAEALKDEVAAPETSPNGIIFYVLAAVADRVAQFFSRVPSTPPSDIDKQRADVAKDVTKASKGLSRLSGLLASTSRISEEAALQGTIQSDIACLGKMQAEIQAATTTEALQEICIGLYAMLSYYAQLESDLEKDDTAEPWWQLMFNATGSGLVSYISEYSQRVAKEFGGEAKLPGATLPEGLQAREEHPKRSLRLLLAIWLRALAHGLQPAGTKPGEVAALLDLSKYAVETESGATPAAQGQSFAHYPPFDSQKPTDSEASPVNAGLWAFNQAMQKAAGKPAAETTAILETAKKLDAAFKVAP